MIELICNIMVFSIGLAFLCAILSVLILLTLQIWKMIEEDHPYFYKWLRKIIGHPLPEPEFILCRIGDGVYQRRRVK